MTRSRTTSGGLLRYLAWFWTAGLLTLAAPQPVRADRTCELLVLPTAFGVYLPINPQPLEATGRITVRCWGQLSSVASDFYRVSMNGGNSSNPANRFMTFDMNRLFYNLYKDPARTTVWGDGSHGTSVLTHELLGLRPQSHDHIVYGQVFPLQFPPAGEYRDTLIVTIEY